MMDESMIRGVRRRLGRLGAVGALMLGCEDPGAEPAPTAPAPSPETATAASSATPRAPAPSASASSAADRESEQKAVPESIAAQHVLVAYRGAKRAPRSVERGKSEARRRAREVHDKAQAGANFSDLAREYSDDPGGKANRGNLGKFKREAMVEAFSDAAFRLEVGEISEPVQTEFGFHVIKRNQ